MSKNFQPKLINSYSISEMLLEFEPNRCHVQYRQLLDNYSIPDAKKVIKYIYKNFFHTLLHNGVSWYIKIWKSFNSQSSDPILSNLLLKLQYLLENFFHFLFCCYKQKLICVNYIKTLFKKNFKIFYLWYFGLVSLSEDKWVFNLWIIYLWKM